MLLDQIDGLTARRSGPGPGLSDLPACLRGARPGRRTGTPGRPCPSPGAAAGCCTRPPTHRGPAGRSASRNPPTTSICHSSIGAPRSPPPVLCPPPPAGLDQPGPHQRPVDPRLRWQRTYPEPAQLEGDPPRPPRPVHPPQLQHLRLDPRIHLMRAAGRPVRPACQPLQATRLIPGQPRMHRLPGHTPPARYRTDRAALADHRQDSLIPLLRHAHLPHERECQGSAEATASYQPEHCQASADGQMSGISRGNTKHGCAARDLNPEPAD